ncbi:MAG: ABC transporter permease [Microthrixaceae bacterium]|nr:ABC transporter permease [Microthrixaceae bacterium]
MASHVTPPLRPVAAQEPLFAYLRQMWRRRDFATALPMEEVRARHQDTLLGNLWHVGNPLLTVLVYYVIFGVILNASRGVDNYLLWLTIGVFSYNLTSKTVLAGAQAITSNEGLIRAVQFPRALLPVSVTFSHIITFWFELGMLSALSILMGLYPNPRWLAIPVFLVIQSAFNLGAAMIVARLNDGFRDVAQIVPFLFRLGTYASGVMFPLTRIDERVSGPLALIVKLNPFSSYLALYRWSFLGTPLTGFTLGVAGGWAFVALVWGFRFFRRAELRYGRG